MKKPQVFLSYAHDDREFGEELSRRLTELLPGRPEPRVVFDPTSSLEPGENIREAIQSAMHDADTVVFVNSPATDSSHWVSYEAGLADALGKDIIVVGQKGHEKSDLLKRLSATARFVELDLTG